MNKFKYINILLNKCDQIEIYIKFINLKKYINIK